MSVEVYDNRAKQSPYRPHEPIVRGAVSKISSWAGSANILITLETGYTISLPKSLVPELVKAADTND